jgi:hypothetical protein
MSEAVAAAALLLGIAICGGPLILAIRGRRRIWIVLSAIWLLLSLVPMAAFAVPEVSYWVAWARCGQQPAIASNFAAGDWYDLPGDYNYGPSLFDAGYYCNAAAAERAGYHRGLGPIR